MKFNKLFVSSFFQTLDGEIKERKPIVQNWKIKQAIKEK